MNRSQSQIDIHLHPLWRGFQNCATNSSLRRMGQRYISLGSRAEQRLHGLLPTHAEGDQDGRRSPQSKTTGRPLEYQRSHPRTLRADPRRSFEFDVLEYGNGGQLDLLMNIWQSRVYAVPVWTDKAQLAAPIYPGDTVLAVSTADLDYHVGGLAIVGSPTGATEALEIQSLTADTITLKRPVLAHWPAGSWIAPARLGRLPAQQAVNRPTAAIAQAKLRFELEDLASTVAATNSPIQYRGHDTLLRHPNRVEDVSIDYQRLADVFDVETGTPAVIDIPNRPFIVRRHQYLLPDRTRLTAMRGWL